MGGAPNKNNPEVFACLLNDMAEEGTDTVDTSDKVITRNKSVVMFPMNMFSSTMVMKICDGILILHYI